MKFSSDRQTLLAQLERRGPWLLLAVLLLAAALRFWQLGAVDYHYFDEINVPQFGWALLNGKTSTPFVTAHPPLPHYLFAGAIWLYYQLPWVDGTYTAAWQVIDPLSYRWLTAVTGLACVYLVASVLRRLTGAWLPALLASLLVALDGMQLVDSRAGLNNILMQGLGLAALWALVRAWQLRWHTGWLAGSGILLGATVATKWNGLGFWLIPAGLLVVEGLRAGLDRLRPVGGAGQPWRGPSPWQWLLCLVLVPTFTYWLCWQPYLWLEAKWSFWEIHQQLRSFHTQGVGASDHPYCSLWYQWPWQGRPMSYLYQALTPDAAGLYRVVHLLGNPLLYPLALLAWLAVAVHWLRLIYGWLQSGQLGRGFWLLAALVLGFGANFLPWMLVRRCLFSYHYEPASLFSFAACAWLLWQMLRYQYAPVWRSRAMAGVALLLIVALIGLSLYFLPINIGQPILREDFYQRMWFDRWI